MRSNARIEVRGNALIFAGRTYACTLGKGGLISAAQKREGDGCTPIGTFALRECWYRADRISKPETKLPLRIIQPDDCWCDDPAHALYNRHFKLPLSTPTTLNSPPLEGGARGGVPTADAYPKKHIPLAKALRQHATEVEKRLWYRLRNKQVAGAKFGRQQPVGKYIADFICIEQKLIIELDGWQHNDSVSDVRRDAFLESEGYTVLRFWNNEVMENIEGVLQRIYEALGNAAPTPHPNLLPQGEKEPEPTSFERLWREDHAYNLVIPLGYNDDPVIPGKGSAIFLHCMHDDGRATAGCVALKYEDLLEIVTQLKHGDAIIIER